MKTIFLTLLVMSNVANAASLFCAEASGNLTFRAPNLKEGESLESGEIYTFTHQTHGVFDATATVLQEIRINSKADWMNGHTSKEHFVYEVSYPVGRGSINKDMFICTFY